MQLLAIFDAELEIGNVFRLSGERLAVLEHLERWTIATRVVEDGRIAFPDLQFRVREGVIADRDKPITAEQRPIFLGLELDSVKLGLRRIGKGGEQPAAASEGADGFDRLLDLLVEDCRAKPLLRREIPFIPGFAV